MNFAWLLLIFTVPAVLGFLYRKRGQSEKTFSATQILSGKHEYFRGRYAPEEVKLYLGRNLRKISHDGELGILALHPKAEDFVRSLKVQLGFLCDSPELYLRLPERIKVAHSLGELKGIPAVFTVISENEAVFTTPKKVQKMRFDKLQENSFREFITRKTELNVNKRVTTKMTGVNFPLGQHRSGKVFDFDLLNDHHAMILGASGSGKTVLLSSILAGISTDTDPEELRFLLLDFKGGTGLSKFSEASACDHLATDLDLSAARRVLKVLESEIITREKEIVAAGANSALEAGIPRLLVVIDELPALLQQVPDATTHLNDIAQRGRGLGIHLLIASQTLRGVPSSLLNNIGCRILLLHRDNHERETFMGKAGLINIDVGQMVAGGEIYSVITRETPRTFAGAPKVFRSSWLPELPAEYLCADSKIIGLADDICERSQYPLQSDFFGNTVLLLSKPGSGETNAARVFARAWNAMPILSPEEVWDAVEYISSGESLEPLVLPGIDKVLEQLPQEWEFELVQRLRAIVSSQTVKVFLGSNQESSLRGFEHWANSRIEMVGKTPGRAMFNEEVEFQFRFQEKPSSESSYDPSGPIAIETSECLSSETISGFEIYSSRELIAKRAFPGAKVQHISQWRASEAPQIFWKVDLIDFRMFMQLRDLPPAVISRNAALRYFQGEFQRVFIAASTKQIKTGA